MKTSLGRTLLALALLSALVTPAAASRALRRQDAPHGARGAARDGARGRRTLPGLRGDGRGRGEDLHRQPLGARHTSAGPEGT